MLFRSYQALAHASRVLVYSPGLSAADLGALGIEKVTDLQATLDALLPSHPRLVAAPEGPYVVGLVKE